VPQIYVGETHVGGFDDLYALDQAGRLDPLLKGKRGLPKPAEKRARRGTGRQEHPGSSAMLLQPNWF
jgi:hypothetical protein